MLHVYCLFCSVQTLAPLNPVPVDQTTNKVTSQQEGQPHSDSQHNEYEGIDQQYHNICILKFIIESSCLIKFWWD